MDRNASWGIVQVLNTVHGWDGERGLKWPPRIGSTSMRRFVCFPLVLYSANSTKALWRGAYSAYSLGAVYNSLRNLAYFRPEFLTHTDARAALSTLRLIRSCGTKLSSNSIEGSETV